MFLLPHRKLGELTMQPQIRGKHGHKQTEPGLRPTSLSLEPSLLNIIYLISIVLLLAPIRDGRWTLGKSRWPARGPKAKRWQSWRQGGHDPDPCSFSSNSLGRYDIHPASHFTLRFTEDPNRDTRASQVVLVVKNPPANAGDTTDVGSILGQEGPLEEEMAPHSSILAWKIPWAEEPSGLQSMWSQRVGHDWVTNISEC